MIDRAPGGVDGRERHDLVVQRARELGQRIGVRARRPARVRHVPLAIEHEAARALEILLAGFERREIDDAVDSIAARVDERVEHVRPALAAAVGGQHRVEHGRAVGVQAQPVVRKNLVGQRRRPLAGELMHAHAGVGERERQRVELAQCA